MGEERERGKSKGSMVVAHKERLSERGKIEGGERERLALPKAIKV